MPCFSNKEYYYLNILNDYYFYSDKVNCYIPIVHISKYLDYDGTKKLKQILETNNIAKFDRFYPDNKIIDLLFNNDNESFMLGISLLPKNCYIQLKDKYIVHKTKCRDNNIIAFYVKDTSFNFE